MYVVEWKTTETVEHSAVVDAATMRTMLGLNASVDVGTIPPGDMGNHGDRGLANGLADIEDSDTEVSYDGPYREEITVRYATPEEVATSGQ